MLLLTPDNFKSPQDIVDVSKAILTQGVSGIYNVFDQIVVDQSAEKKVEK